MRFSVYHERERDEGEYVLYRDHLTEMREVLDMLVKRSQSGLAEPMNMRKVLDKYLHYLEKGK